MYKRRPRPKCECVADTTKAAPRLFRESPERSDRPTLRKLGLPLDERGAHVIASDPRGNTIEPAVRSALGLTGLIVRRFGPSSTVRQIKQLADGLRPLPRPGRPSRVADLAISRSALAGDVRPSAA